MKSRLKHILSGFIILFSLQVIAAEEVHRYWVVLKDKANSTYSVSKPEMFLSKRAIERRTRFQIPVTEQDFPVNGAYLEQVRATGVKVLGTSRWMNAVLVECKDRGCNANLAVLSGVKEVIYLGKAGLKKKNNVAEIYNGTAEKPEPTEEKGTFEEYGTALKQIEQLNGVDLHKSGYKGEGMVIAVIDAGFYKVNSLKPFEYLRATHSILGTRDFIEGNDSVYEDDTHGMQVLSCMAGNYPGKMIGTAPKAKYWLLRSEDASQEYPYEEAFWVLAAEFADSAGADIINSSLGYYKYDDPAMNYEYEQMDGKTAIASRAARIAHEKGMIVVVAAGNEGDGEWKYITVPSDAAGVLAVAAVDEQGKKAKFSSIGPSSDKRVKPDLAAQGERTAVATTYNSVWTSNGTSFASPVLAGMIACLWQSNPDKSNEEVIAALKKSASQYMIPDDELGYGIPNVVLANRMLGGDRAFEYNRDQVVELFTYDSFEYIVFNFFSAFDQELTVELVNSKGDILTSKKIKVTTRSFTKESITGYKKLKAGVYKLKIKGSSGSTFSYDIIRD